MRTLAVNLLGCFLIGLMWGVFSKNGTEGSNWALFLTAGRCGGFKTFSTFSKEALVLLQGGNIWGFTDLRNKYQFFLLADYGNRMSEVMIAETY